MRIRSVKPEFWQSRDTAQVSYFARLLFIGIWNYVDDNGVGDDDIDFIRAQLFPRDSKDQTLSTLIGGALDELAKVGMLQRYTGNDGRPYIFVTGWSHQRIDRPTASRKPLPHSSLSDNSTRGPVGLVDDSTLEQGNKGTRERGNEGTRALAVASDESPTKSKRGTRIDPDFRPSRRCIDAIKAELNVDDAFLTHEHRKFIDYWQAKSGANASKLDWTATWRNWMRTAAERGGRVRPGQASGADAKAAGWQAMKNA